MAEHVFGMADKYKLYHRCFMVNFMKLFRTDIFQNTSSRDLLDLKSLTFFVRHKYFNPKHFVFQSYNITYCYLMCHFHELIGEVSLSPIKLFRQNDAFCYTACRLQIQAYILILQSNQFEFLVAKHFV